MFGKKNEDNSIWGTYEREKQLEEKKKAEQAEAPQHQKMWVEDRSIHRMTRKKEIIAVIVIAVVVLLFIVLSILGKMSRFRSIPRY